MNHACKILLSYYCSAQLFETAMIDWKAWVKIGKQMQLQVKEKKKEEKEANSKWQMM